MYYWDSLLIIIEHAHQTVINTLINTDNVVDRAPKESTSTSRFVPTVEGNLKKGRC